jgi:hypothetical protein
MLIMAERQGFEPWIGVTYTHFPGVRLQPLGHLSGSGFRSARVLPPPPYRN